MALYDDVLNIAREYIGPAAENFITRKMTAIRVVDSKDLSKEHLDNLALSIQATAKIYMSEDQAVKFRQDILALKNK
jgi:hypothetical protein